MDLITSFYTSLIHLRLQMRRRRRGFISRPETAGVFGSRSAAPEPRARSRRGHGGCGPRDRRGHPAHHSAQLRARDSAHDRAPLEHCDRLRPVSRANTYSIAHVHLF